MHFSRSVLVSLRWNIIRGWPRCGNRKGWVESQGLGIKGVSDLMQCMNVNCKYTYPNMDVVDLFLFIYVSFNRVLMNYLVFSLTINNSMQFEFFFFLVCLLAPFFFFSLSLFLSLLCKILSSICHQTLWGPR